MVTVNQLTSLEFATKSFVAEKGRHSSAQLQDVAGQKSLSISSNAVDFLVKIV